MAAKLPGVAALRNVNIRGRLSPVGHRVGVGLAPLGWIMPKGVRPIAARAVASALLAAILDAKPGVRVLKSGAMQARDQP